MANGRPGDSVFHDIVHLRIETFGPSCDGLVREIAAKLPPSHLAEFQELIETWPWTPDGRPEDTDRLFHLLLDWRERVARLPRDPAAPTARRRLGRALLGFVLGAVTGVVGALLLAGLFTTMPTGDAAMGMAIGLVFFVLPAAALLGGVVGAVLLARR